MSQVIGMTKEMQALRDAVTHNLPVMMVGETGVGKTYMILEIAKEFGKDAIRISLNGEVGITELLGKFTLSNSSTVWQDGILVKAMREGGWVILDELNAALPEVLFCLNSLMDGSRSLVLAEKDGEVVTPHEDFRIFATINPCDSYVGTKELNPALLSRFPIILNVDYPEPEAELQILKSQTPVEDPIARIIVDVCNSLRQAKREGKISVAIGVRDAVNWAVVSSICEGTLSSSFEWAILNKTRNEDRAAVVELAKNASQVKVNWVAKASTIAKKLTKAMSDAMAGAENKNAKLQAIIAGLQEQLVPLEGA